MVPLVVRLFPYLTRKPISRIHHITSLRRRGHNSPILISNIHSTLYPMRANTFIRNPLLADIRTLPNHQAKARTHIILSQCQTTDPCMPLWPSLASLPQAILAKFNLPLLRQHPSTIVSDDGVSRGCWDLTLHGRLRLAQQVVYVLQAQCAQSVM